MQMLDRRDEGSLSDDAVMALMEADDLLDLLDYEDWRPSRFTDYSYEDAMYDPEDDY